MTLHSMDNSRALSALDAYLTRGPDEWDDDADADAETASSSPTAAIERLYMPPAASAFVGDDDQTVDFLAAPDLTRGVDRLAERFPEDLAALAGITVVCLWKAAGGKSAGKAVLGKTTKLAGLARYLSGYLDGEAVDFVIWLAADHLALRSDRGIEAILFHELLHIGTDDNGNPTVRPHDWAGFAREIELFGLHTEDARTVDRAFRQLHLAGTAPRSAE